MQPDWITLVSVINSYIAIEDYAIYFLVGFLSVLILIEVN